MTVMGHFWRVARRAAAPLFAAYAWPLDAPPTLTSSYGDFRAQHFHGGIDLSTGRRIGVPVRAVANGTVARVRASGVGYGLSVYLRLDAGRTAVYAHLDAFEEKLGAWVAAVQESTARYEQDLYPPAGRFHYKRGQTIGFSGETGAGPPHLHVELREGEMGLNPLAHGLAVKDGVRPAIEALWVTPSPGGGQVEGSYLPKRYDAQGGNGAHRLAAPVPVWGPIRLAVEASDGHDAGSARLGIYRVEAWLDGEPIYGAHVDSVSWLETREVKVAFDYEARAAERGSRRAYALYAMPGLRAGVAWRAAHELQAGMGTHELRVRCVDAADNEAELLATLRWDPPAASVPMPPPGGGSPLVVLRRGGVVVRPYGLDVESPTPPRQLNADGSALYEVPDSFRGRLALSRPGGDLVLQLGRAEPGWRSVVTSDDGRFSVEIGPEAPFEAHPVAVEDSPEPGPVFPWGETVSGSYRVHPAALPWRETLGLELSFPDGVPDRAGLFLLGEDGPALVGSDAGPKALRGGTRDLGDFVAVRDTVPPVAGEPEVRGPKQGSRSRGSLRVRWPVRDEGAGFGPDEVRLWVDGKAAPVEYDVDAKRAVWRPHRVPPPGTRAYRLEVTDKLGNRTVREGRFTHR